MGCISGLIHRRGSSVTSLSMNPREELAPASLFQALREGDRVALGRAITLVESTLPAHRTQAAELVSLCLPFSGNGFRIGISGAPGVGKSTFIETFGSLLTGQGHRVAVLAIDPSSGLNRGSILGDKTRMDRLSRDPSAFIRPSPAGSTLGGVARKTREAILLCEAAGYDRILVETVGVGQSETAVQAMTDLFLLLLLPGAGDELQGIKRGVVEMADMILVNKADGARATLAEESRLQYLRAVHLFPEKESGQPVRVLKASALEHSGMDGIFQATEEFRTAVQASGYLAKRRREQAAWWLKESLMDQLSAWVFDRFGEDLSHWEREVLEGRSSPFRAADAIMAQIRGGEPTDAVS